MNALVIKTNKIVNIVRKEKEHYIDDNFNPYTKDELEFFIKQNYAKKRTKNDDFDEEEQETVGIDFNGQFMSFDDWNKLQIANSHIEKILWLAATVIEQHPDLDAKQVADYCLLVYDLINQHLK